MGQLEGRVAIITGAAGGIGRATAKRYAEEGARLVLADIAADSLVALKDELKSSGADAVAVSGDISSEAHLDEVVASAIEQFGQLDILANIAQGGMAEVTYLEDTTAEVAERAFRSGALQSMLLMQKAFPHMRERGYGRIINTSSAAAVYGLPGFSAYEMTKGAVMALTRNASQEWAKYGIVTNTFLPLIHTPAYDLSEQGREQARTIADRNPTGRFGTPFDDCTPVLTFLASEGAGYINGQAIGVDGGMYILA